VERPSTTYFSRRAGILFAAHLVSAIVSYGAQAPARPVGSPVMRQLQRAIEAANHGDKRQALILTTELMNEYPDFVPVLKLEGILLEELGRGTEAAQIYGRTLQLAPNDPVLLFKLGIYHLKEGDEEQAIHLLLRHLKLLPGDGDAFFYLAQAYHLNTQNDLALKAIRASAKLEPDNPQVWQKYGELLSSSGDSEEALRWLLKAQGLDPTLERIDFDIGVADYYNMDFANAVKYSTRAAERQPNDLSVLTLLASSEEKLSRYLDAQSTFKRILALKNDDVSSLLGLGHCEFELRQYQPAVDTLQHLLQVDPTQMQAHYYLSSALTGLGKTVEAQHEASLHHMMEQMSLAPPELGSEGKKDTWSQAKQLLIEHREDEALQLFQRDSKKSKTHGDSFVLVGSLYLSLGDAEDGLRNLRRALEVDPMVRGAHTYVGTVALRQGDLGTAEEEFEAELANDPNYLPAVAALGEVRYRQQRWREASDLFLRSRTTTPTSLYMLCDSYFRIGRVSEAGLAAETLAALSRDDRKTTQELIELLNRHDQTELAQRLSSNLRPE
jgi:tetratricopeptide (TPR) repeat protein